MDIKLKKSHYKNIKSNIIISFIIFFICAACITFLFKYISKNYIKQTFSKYNLNVNETIAIYEVEKQVDMYIFIAIAFLTLFLIVWLISTYIIEKRERKKFEKVLENINNIQNQDYKFVIKELDNSFFGVFQNEIYQKIMYLQYYSMEIEKDKNTLAEYLQDISHQLRTPLLSLSVLTDALLENNISHTEKERKFVYEISNQINRMRWLVENLLKMAQLDIKSVVLKKEKINLKEMLTEVLNNLSILLEVKNQVVNIQCKKELILIGDLKWNEEAFTNIIKNASEHSENKTTIYIYCTDNPLYTEICIQDEGEGIKEEELLHIFDRFYKGKNSNTNSFGIGLYLAKKIIELQNGEINVVSKLEIGTKFIIRFYK